MITCKIMAPAASAHQASEAIAAGADELYCGAMFDDWVERFGDSDVLSRRQGQSAHVTSPEELAGIVKAAGPDRPVALALNGRYTSGQEPMILELARHWEEIGGRAVLASDIGLLLALRNSGSALRIYVSLLANTFNSMTSTFFAELGASRIVLPRELTIREIRSLTSNGPAEMEYECLVLNQKCQFIDGMCGFYHGTSLPGDVPCTFDYHMEPGETMPVVRSHDPDYEGHGCELSWQWPGGSVKPLQRDDMNSPHCAACQLMDLVEAGVRFFKIAGRGFDTNSIVRSVRFIREAVHVRTASPRRNEALKRIRLLYSESFPVPCEKRKCYYTD